MGGEQGNGGVKFVIKELQKMERKRQGEVNRDLPEPEHWEQRWRGEKNQDTCRWQNQRNLVATLVWCESEGGEREIDENCEMGARH